jgi:hypothetical protein
MIELLGNALALKGVLNGGKLGAVQQTELFTELTVIVVDAVLVQPVVVLLAVKV